MKTVHSLQLIATIVLCFVIGTASAAQPDSEAITISLPARSVLLSLQNILPFQFAADSENMEGTIIVRSIDALKIHDNTLSVHGVLEGSNVAMVTKVADQNIRMKLGKVTLPIACDLQTRYDRGSKQLFLTPLFPAKSVTGKSSPASIRPLLSAIAGKEYPITLDNLRLANLKIGDQDIPLTMIPVAVTGNNNTLVLELKPHIEKKKK